MIRRSTIACVVLVLLSLAGSGCQEEKTVTSAALSATCEARPSTGPAPLAVSFILGVSGAEGPFTVAVGYGDGASGTDPDAPHTYATAGSYTAAFTVTTATQSARCSTSVTVQPGTAPSPGANRPPEAVFKTLPAAVGGTITGTAPLSVRFNMCLSADPDGDKIYFTMDFDGDGDIDQGGTTGGNCRRDHVYSAGTWTAHDCLRDIDASGKALHEDQCRTYSVAVAP
jgi:hypothetical protein